MPQRKPPTSSNNIHNNAGLGAARGEGEGLATSCQVAWNLFVAVTFKPASCKHTPWFEMQRALHKFESSDSVVFLDPRGRTDSSESTSVRATPLHEFGDNVAVSIGSPFQVEVSIRRGRLLMATVLIVGMIMSIVLVLYNGITIDRFTTNSDNDPDRKHLLDEANSRIGNIASAIARPIEVFVTVLAQLISLRFMAHTYKQPKISWRHTLIPIVISASIGYLINNGLNAVNIQFRSRFNPVIMASDLSILSELKERLKDHTTKFTNTIPETSSNNVISNTVLRTAVLPRVPLNQSFCDWEMTRFERLEEPSLPSIDFGFTHRDWQSHILQEALPAKTFKIIVNSTMDKTSHTNAETNRLPMNATLAADLFHYAMIVGANMFPWGRTGDFVDQTALAKRYPESERKNHPNFVEKAAIVTGLLPPSNNLSEPEKRDWFLKTVSPSVLRQFNRSVNTSRSNIGVTFSHVEISPLIDFDAVTMEVELDPTLLTSARSTDNTTRYTQVTQAAPPGVLSDCGPWPALCLVRSSYTREPRQLIHTFSSCATPYGDNLMSLSYGSTGFQCTQSSNSSIMIMSIGKQLLADSIQQNKSDNVTSRSGTPALITNLRKIYTFTIGRLSWRLEDLATAFHANCGTEAETLNCFGLHLQLTPDPPSRQDVAANGKKSQILVVNADGLPTRSIKPSAMLAITNPLSVPLVEVNEATNQGDMLLRHNIGTIVWTNETVKNECDSDMENFFYTKLNNHMYIEHGFQAAYTAGIFYLFQDAVVQNVIVADWDIPDSYGAKQATTLNFDGNFYSFVTEVSTPSQSAILSFAGCAVVVLCVLVMITNITCPTAETDAATTIAAPEAIARVMTNDEKFPPFFLHRRVVNVHDENPTSRPLDEFKVAHLVVVHEKVATRYDAVME